MTPREVDAIWDLLSQTWGAKFIDQYGPRPNDAWSGMLEAVDCDSARAAYRALVLSGTPFPPTLPEFLAEARNHVRKQIREADTAQHLLPPPKGNPDVARENLERLRRLLNS